MPPEPNAGAALAGAALHRRALERLCPAPPISRPSARPLAISGEGRSRTAGEEVGRGAGTFTRSRIPLSGLPRRSAAS